MAIRPRRCARGSRRWHCALPSVVCGIVGFGCGHGLGRRHDRARRVCLGRRLGCLGHGVDVPIRDCRVGGLDPVAGDDVLAPAARDAGHGTEGGTLDRAGERRHVGERDHGVGRGRELRGREAGHRRGAAAEESEVAQPVALERDRAAGVAPGLDRLAEGRRDIAQRGLEPVAAAAQAVDPGESRGVGLGMADHDRRGVGGSVSGDDAVEPGLVERDLAAVRVVPGAGAANVDPAVERAHGRGAAIWAEGRIGQTMRPHAALVHQTIV